MQESVHSYLPKSCICSYRLQQVKFRVLQDGSSHVKKAAAAIIIIHVLIQITLGYRLILQGANLPKRDKHIQA